MELLTQLISKLNVPAQILDATGKIVYSNQEFIRLFGLLEDHAGGTHGGGTQGGCGLSECPINNELERALAGETITVGPVKIEKPHDLQASHLGNSQVGDGISIKIDLKPLFSDNGEVFAVVAFANPDSNPEEKYETDLLKIQKGENLEILASGVAHEFNNIFTGIKGLTDLIKDEVDQTSEAFEFAQMIQQNITRGAGLIQQLSSFARQLPHSLRPRVLGDYIEQAMPLLQIQIQRRISLETRILSDGTVNMDKSRMDQALSNIMHNARDAMGGQGIIVVTVDEKSPPNKPNHKWSPDTKWLQIEIADSGPGIPEELVARVLEPFFSTKEQGKSTGLGLSVTSRIVTSHNGYMQIGRSEELGGAAISIYLPVQEPAKPQAK